MLLLMELALVDGIDKASDPSHSCSINSLLELLPMDSGDCCNTELESYIKCSLQGTVYSVNSTDLSSDLILLSHNACYSNLFAFS